MRYLLHRESIWIPIVLIVILIGCWSELDLYAPSFPQMMHFFQTTEQAMQWTLSLNFLGFFIASLFCGPLADGFGRRPVILGGTVLFLLGSTVCVSANSIEMMLLGRLIQGIGVSAPVTVCMAVIADIYQGERQVRLLTRMNASVTVTMALAPIVGVFLSESYGWRANFFVIFAIALIGFGLVWMLIPETLTQENKTPFSPKSLIAGYLSLLQSAPFMYATLGLCLLVTPYFVFVGAISLLFMEELGVSIEHYAIYQGSVVGLFSFLSLLLPYILVRFSPNGLMRYGLAFSVGGIGISFLLSLVLPDNPMVITGLMLVYVVGVVVPPTLMFADAMDMHPQLRGSASSLIQAVRMLFMAIGTAMAGSMYNGNYRPIVFVMFLFVAASAPFVYLSIRNREGRTEEKLEGVLAVH